MGRNRSISSIIGKATRRPSQPMLTRKKRDNKVPCYCNQCNGKLVLKQTKLFHESADGSITTIQDSGNEQLSAELLAHDAGSPPYLKPETSLPSHLETETDSPALGTEPHSLIPRRHPRRYTQVTNDLSDSEAEQYIESSFGEDEDSEHYKDNESIMMMQLVVIVRLIYLFQKLLKIICHPILNHLEMKRNQQSMANFHGFYYG